MDVFNRAAAAREGLAFYYSMQDKVVNMKQRHKFKIFYPQDHYSLAGKEYKVTGTDMLVMNSSGIFFVYSGEDYYPGITKLSDKIGNYDVKWN
jgi:hypothetical protein